MTDFAVETDAGRIAGWRAGSGPPALVLHGGPGLSDITEELAAELADRFSTIRYQQRGLAPSTVEQNVADALAVGEFEERAVQVIGIARLAARTVVFGLIGWFLVKAAIEHDPQEAVALDGALARLAEAPYGPVLLGFTAAGLIAYGLFCVAQARYRRVWAAGTPIEASSVSRS
jgi:pimeloyl-ACP methyl ester carboxylesterase